MNFNEGIKQSEKGYKQVLEGDKIISHAVVHDFLYTWQWWLGIMLFILPWVIWIIFRKKDSTGRLLIGGFITIIISVIIDLITDSVGTWTYPMKFIPIGSKLLLPYHFSLTPVAIMFALQIKPKANPLLKGALLGVISAFGVMKIFVWMKFYDPKGWPSIFDFLIFLFLFFAAYLCSNKLEFKSISEKNSANK
ncbi:CBO0543 family protein [Heyndrickxia sp. NPDC080065]|uniref:CBO0543 family protein n=1 Tax=Heyndrickxia sp. NPDC080065 TaxID=3390568 RepID=UPI003D002EEE